MELRCVCLDQKFADLLRYARQHGITSVGELCTATGCGTKCGMCRPHLEELLKTGRITIAGVAFDFPDPDRARPA
jgi:bacterioferritin-associated ferredoxin